MRWHVAAFTALSIALLAVACGSQNLTDSAGNGGGFVPFDASPVCGPGKFDCPCPKDGQSVPCGTVVSKSGDYVTCTAGTSTCQNGRWGACQGATVVTKSVGASTLGAGGLHVTANSGGCMDPCDPTCMQTGEGSGDVDASGVAITDAGVTIQPTPVDGASDATTCTGLQCQVDWQCPGGSPTTLSGVIFDPAGVNPLYDAYVYVPVNPSGNLPAFSTGASCSACPSGTLQAVAVAQTGPDGAFTLTNVPSTDLAPNAPIPLVVQMGKWRRVVMLPSVPKCQTTTVARDDSRLPRSMFDGYGGHADIPRMAIATGAVDPFECMMLKMGLDPAEFQLPGSGTRRIDFYVANGQQFLGGNAPPESQLVGSPGTLMGYDAIILPCEGFEDDGNDQYADYVSAYANAGGRLFATHYGYTWLSTPSNFQARATNPATGNPNPFYPVAKWDLANGAFNAEPATIDQGFPKGAAFAQWLQNVGATTTLGTLTLASPRWDVDGVNAPATEWMHDTNNAKESFHFTFDTPIDASADAAPDAGGYCGRVVYSDFHVSTADLTQNASCYWDQDCGVTASCQHGGLGTCSPVACTTSADCPDPMYTCSGSPMPGACAPRTCNWAWDCATGQCNTGTHTCGCNKNSQCSSLSCNTATHTCNGPAASCARDWQCGSSESCQGAVIGACTRACNSTLQCTGGELCVNGQCQGCEGASYCPSGVCQGAQQGTCSAYEGGFPVGCVQGPLSPQEDALEFMLLDLTACVSPDNQPPPPPPPPVVIYTPVTFTEDFMSSCPAGTHVVWRELDWHATIPASASIVFSAQTVDPPPSYGGAQRVQIADATASSPPQGDKAYIDTPPSGAFNTATPPLASKVDLRLTITLNPTADQKAAPTLTSWQVMSDCPPSE